MPSLEVAKTFTTELLHFHQKWITGLPFNGQGFVRMVYSELGPHQ